MAEPLFCSLDSAAIAHEILRAQRSVCYAAPGVHQKPADAMAALANRIGPELITVCIDFDERVLRMGFGDLSAVEILRDAGIIVTSTPGLRTGLVIVDDQGYIFTPTALYLEAEQGGIDAPNALRLSRDQATEAQARLSPAAKAIAVARANTAEERARLKEQAVEIKSTQVDEAKIGEVSERLKEAPPVSFDVARQVRIFEFYLQYVDLRLTGAAIHRHRISIPRRIQNLGSYGKVPEGLRTTFDLIERESELSSKPIEDELNEIRKNLTQALGKEHGRVILKSRKPLLEKRLTQLRAKLESYQGELKQKLQKQLDASRAAIVNYYLPRVIANPPEAFLGQFPSDEPAEEDARKWLIHELETVFPGAEQLIKEMELDVTYKDLTFETLNRKDFLPRVQQAYPILDWEKPYKEFRAAGEKHLGQ